MSAGVHQLDGIVLAISFFPRMEGEKDEIYPLAIVGRASNVGDRVGLAAAQGLDQALVSTGVECCMKGLRGRVFSDINFLWPARIFTKAGEHRIPVK